MSENIPLTVTLELPASELLEHEGALLVRCPLNGNWVPLTDYYSENQGALLPLVGNVNHEETPEHWIEKKTLVKDAEGNVTEQVENNEQGLPVMVKVAKETPVVWKEVVRILAKAPEAPAEGGTLNVGAGEDVNMKDKF